VSVYNAGFFTINGGEISDNTAPSGGGVEIESEVELIMNGGKISDNTASGGGGGVYASESPGATFAMNGGEISGNTAKDGGGVYIGGGSDFTMSDGKISGNTAFGNLNVFYGGCGGGVLVSSLTETSFFTMSGGEISDNTASSFGGGVYKDGSFTMSGGARVSVNNAVCLDYNSITIGGNFTGPTGPVAQIDLKGSASNWSGKAVLKLADSYSGNLATLKSRFTLGNFDSTPITGYVIDNNGTLQSN
jgi:hypothetical protein